MMQMDIVKGRARRCRIGIAEITYDASTCLKACTFTVQFRKRRH